jgi:hypothetical protein
MVFPEPWCREPGLTTAQADSNLAGPRPNKFRSSLTPVAPTLGALS